MHPRGSDPLEMRWVATAAPEARRISTGGNAASTDIDVFGEVDKTMRYARIRLEAAPAARP